jgi:hypothetical protein
MFPSVVAASRLHLWNPGDPVRLDGLRLLIGVAPSYNLRDLATLDLIEISLPTHSAGAWVDVFDVDTCRAQSDLQTFFPGITKVLQTPVMGIWSAGDLTEVLQGFHARERVERMFQNR